MQNQNSKDLKYVMLLGYGWSGSGAIVDLLREFDGYFAMDRCEFRLLRDPYGVMNLENSLIDQWDPLVYDNSIRDFLWYAETLDRTPGKFTREGGYYNSFYGPQFKEATEHFIDKITDYTYDCYWFFFDYKMSVLQNTVRKIKRKLNRKKFESNMSKNMYFTTITREEFHEAVREYIDEVFSPIAEKKKASTMVMDQAIPAQLPNKSADYFHNAKTIIVDRDPRDIYAELVRDEKLVGKDIKRTGDVMKFVKWHKAYRRGVEEYKKDPNILYLQFEDIVQNYDENIARILEFLGEDASIHNEKLKKTLFDPSRSAKNIGIWRQYAKQEEMNVLYHELQDYCYQGI